MPRALKNATITHVSYVDKGANKKKFFLTKSEQEPTFQKDVRLLINKEDTQQLVYGVVYEPEVEDSQGDLMDATEIEKAAHLFLKEYRNIDKQHDFEAGVGEVVESYVAPADIEVGGETITKGSWVLVTKASDEVWDQIQKGEITGYSMAGTAETEDLKKEEDTQMKSFFKMLKEFFTTDVTKGELKDAYNKTRKRRNLFDALYMFENFVAEELWKENPDADKLREYSQEIGDIFYDVATSPDIIKSFKKEHEEREELQLTKEELQSIMKEALEPVSQRLDALEKKDEGEEAPVAKTEEGVSNPEGSNEEEPVTKSEEEKQADQVALFKSVVTEALAPIESRLETVEKARGISKSADTDDANIEKEDKGGTWDNLFTV